MWSRVNSLPVNKRFLGGVWEVESPGECDTATPSDLIYVEVGEDRKRVSLVSGWLMYDPSVVSYTPPNPSGRHGKARFL